MREVTYHRSSVKDLHSDIHIHANVVGVGGASTDYYVETKEKVVLSKLRFQDKLIEKLEDINGVTNEVLLAIVQDRLEGFQSGKFACEENNRALSLVKLALVELQQRSIRRSHQGLLGKHEEIETTDKTIKPRPRIEKNDHYLFIGDEDIKLSSLGSWGGWQAVENAVKKVVSKDNMLTADELQTIRSCATTSGGKNGYVEFTQAYNRMVGI